MKPSEEQIKAACQLLVDQGRAIWTIQVGGVRGICLINKEEKSNETGRHQDQDHG
jgi:hypothetical protein